MKASGFRYLVKEGVKNLWTNRIMAFTSIGVLTTCLLIVGAAYLLTVNVGSMVSYVETQSEMNVFLKDFDKPEIVVPDTSVDLESNANQPDTDAQSEQDKPVEGDGDTTTRQPTEEEAPVEGETDTAELRKTMVAQIKAQIEGMQNVKSCEYISKEQGFENTKDTLGDSAYLLDGIKDRNYIPDTFVITLNDIEKTAQTKAAIEKLDGVDIVVASMETADTLTYVQRTVNTMGSAIIIALAVISVVIISNTIRATIFARRKEINIMKFVGATNAFIRIPFLVEGFFLGLISAGISYLVIWGGYSYLLQAFTLDISSFLNELFANVIPFNEVAISLAWFFGITGTVLGSLGSAISIRNHARV